MIFFLEKWEVIRDFLETGGQVLLFIGLATLIMWTMILEKYYFFWRLYPKVAADIKSRWESRSDKSSWAAHRVREAMISQTGSQLHQSITVIKTLVALCPLLGLMGTVTGMISVFEVMGYTGTGNARLMASGISMATIPTMAGMVASLSGLYFGTLLERKAKKEKEGLAESLPYC
ncbi:MAG: MotA/TolQ/ExbB proton channel family protein [Pseudobacteriovorax sp.]|nr:MotA/TolQ/ExbB proton channel family protein [Pseudobacteriovorax sp.]